MEHHELFITGYAKLPQGITATELYRVIAVGLIVDRQSGEILDADCSLVTRVARDFVKKLIIGKDLKEIEEIQREFSKKYYGSAKKALISALRTCNEKYNQILNNDSNVDEPID